MDIHTRMTRVGKGLGARMATARSSAQAAKRNETGAAAMPTGQDASPLTLTQHPNETGR